VAVLALVLTSRGLVSTGWNQSIWLNWMCSFPGSQHQPCCQAQPMASEWQCLWTGLPLCGWVLCDTRGHHLIPRSLVV
jgi:hypothetical protein